MLQPQNVPMKYDHLFSDIERGLIKIPKFQRDFVWTTEQTASLLDSMIRGYPIGTFIFWKTRQEMRHYRDIGNIKLRETPRGDAAHYVLDGQQRITSLFAVRKGVRVTKEGEEIDYTKVCIDLSQDPESDERIVVAEPPDGRPHITINELLNSNWGNLVKRFPEHVDRLGEYHKRLTAYDFSTIVIDDYPLDVACDVFTRINTGGTQLTLFEIMVAKTYDPERDFDLAREYDWLVDNKGAEKDLEDAGYETIPTSTVLQCIAAYVSRQLRRRDILRLDKTEFIESWPAVKDGIFTAVDYFRNQLLIPVSRLLPYPALLVPFTYFFIRNGGQPPTARQNQLLVQYFWWASLSQRFSSAVESKLAQDLERMDLILAGEAPNYKGEEIDVTIDGLRERWFSTGDAFCKAILCLYAYEVPKSFASNGMVRLDNSWLKVAFSKNYHHFFPKAYLRRQGVDDALANSILNITLVDDYLNKRKIKGRAPSDYMSEFARSNPALAETMKRHLIDDMHSFGVWEDDYERFLDRRGQKVLEELQERLGPECLPVGDGE